MRQIVQPSASAPRISLEVEQIAATYQLGRPEAEYRTKNERISSFAGLIWMIYLIVLISVGFFFFISGADKTWWLWLVWLFFILMLFLCIQVLLSTLFRPRIAVFVCSSGLIYQKKDQLTAIRWDQVEAYWEDVSISHDGETSDTYHYSLQRNDGLKLEFPDSLVHIQKLGESIARNVGSHLLPRTIAVYRTGAAVAFGDININQQEISVRSGQKKLPWNNFESFTLDKETLAFYQQSQERAWHKQRIAQVANPRVLQGLIDYVAQDRVHQQLPQLIVNYNAGALLVFGRIGISLQGISIDNGKQVLSWNDVSKIDLDMSKRQLSIGTHHKLLDWRMLRTWTTPNTLVLKGLIDYALQKHRQQREAQVLSDLPRAIAFYDAGIPLTFGRISISLQGIAVDNGQQFLPWTDVASIYVRMYIGGERLTILKKGKTLAWQTIRISELGDIELLQQMIEHIMHGHP